MALYGVLQLMKKPACLVFVFYKRVALAVGAKPDRRAHVFHNFQMLNPKMVNRPEPECFKRGRNFFSACLARFFEKIFFIFFAREYFSGARNYFVVFGKKNSLPPAVN